MLLLDPSWFDSPGPVCSPSGSTGPRSPDEQRMLRRKISNRESARRCRVRKRRRFEELRTESDRLMSLNRDLANRAGSMSHRCLLFRHENRRLRLEFASLGRRLSELRQLILLRHVLTAARGGLAHEQALASLMT
ncbi:basic leucine zipper 4-like [Curcuma longa]|uniref:basic leucine zipper 4-like n=1 Tax=Curcuma longa TaxID=136217 RepID=UPI003D9E95B2